jgi:asparagine synthase (glutamine-hydrolysing)
MCGIAGVWNLSPGVDAYRPLAAMLDAMRHRGPDGRGTMQFAGGAAGMVRLALVDLSERGQQPMWSQDRLVAILFNGEMYNFREERSRLERLGYRFQTGTDTEVVLNLYLEHGQGFVEYLRGMYAIALFDRRKTGSNHSPTMLLARGPFGVKPLYVAQADGEPGSVIFASEVRALLASGRVPRCVDREALAEYLSSGFVWQPRTIVAGVRMMEPGTLEIHEPGKSHRREVFWKMPLYEPLDETLDEAAERLRSTLDESIRLHALADAPVGAFLSGGVDSAGIVGLMREHVPNLKSFTLRFPEFPGADESQEASESAAWLGVENTLIDVTGESVAASLPTFAGQLDQPSADGINTWVISRAAAADVKAVLSGVGADEWFGGYPVTRRMTYNWTTAPGKMHAMAAKLAKPIAGLVPPGTWRRRVDGLIARSSPLRLWSRAHAVFGWNEARRGLGLSREPTSEQAHIEDVLTRIMPGWEDEGTVVSLSCLLDTRVYMINQLLRDSDATSMAHSLEMRVPFVDLEVANFARSCDDQHKLFAGGGSGDEYSRSGAKGVLIHALRDVLPPATTDGHKKGFVVPLHRWLQTNLKPLVEETCSSESLTRRGLIDPGLLSRSWQHFHGTPSNHSFRELWAVMVFELWCRAVLD